METSKDKQRLLSTQVVWKWKEQATNTESNVISTCNHANDSYVRTFQIHFLHPVAEVIVIVDVTSVLKVAKFFILAYMLRRTFLVLRTVIKLAFVPLFKYQVDKTVCKYHTGISN